jgi:hypothetical protein
MPASDIPFDRASPALKAAWGTYTVTVIPGSAVFAGIPPAPHVHNLTGGLVSDSEAAGLAAALMRRRRLVQWALANGQIDFLDWFGERAFVDDTWRPLIAAGGKVNLPACATYPVSLTLWSRQAIDDPVTFPDHVKAFFAADFSGPCDVGVPPGSVKVTSAWRTTHTFLIAARLKVDDVIGSVLRGYVSDCATVTNHPEACGARS